MTLKDFFEENTKCALAFSGGCDSSYLLWAAKQYGCQIAPYFMKTLFQPEFELEDAKKLASELSVPLKIIELDALSNPAVVNNDEFRCYHCKTSLFTALREQVKADGYDVLIDGTNASDDASTRPGMKALRELAVRSPLRECGLTKKDVRKLSKEAGLATHDKPAYACLATRIRTGTRITEQDLKRVENAEKTLFDLGFSDLRVRLFHNCAKIELTASQLPEAIKKRQFILERLGHDFDDVLLNLKERAES